MNKATVALIVACFAVVIAGLAYFGIGKVQETLFGSTSCANITCLSGGLRLVADAGGDFESDVAAVFSSTFKLGSSGTSVSRINTGTCYFAPPAATIVATTTKTVDCQATAAVSASGESALPGVAVGDSVVLTLSTTTAGVMPGSMLVTNGCTASSTQGYITCGLSALNGTYTWPVTGTASGTASYIATH